MKLNVTLIHVLAKEWIFKHGMVFHKATPVSNSIGIFLKSIAFDEVRVGL